jgi:hypothetical protein
VLSFVGVSVERAAALQFRVHLGATPHPRRPLRWETPAGVLRDRRILKIVVAAIDSEEFNPSFDTLTRYDKCRTGALRMK